MSIGVHLERSFRGIEIRGEAQVLATGGKDILPGYDPEMFRIKPKRIVNWGLEGERSAANARTVVKRDNEDAESR